MGAIETFSKPTQMTKTPKEAVQINSRFGKLDKLKNDKVSRFDLNMKNEVNINWLVHANNQIGFFSIRKDI